MSELTDSLLRALLTVTARVAYPPELIRGIVQIGSTSEKQIAAYNLCDGTKSQSEIAKALSLDHGNFSRTLARWVEAGIVFRIGDGRDMKPLHVYPIPKESVKKKG